MFGKILYQKQCIVCGRQYETTSFRGQTCGSACARIKQNAYEREKYRQKRRKCLEKNTLSGVAKKAKEAGMSYGEYVARKQVQFEKI